MLDVRKVNKLIDERGLKRAWLIKKIGLKRTAGNALLRDGLLPKDSKVRENALTALTQQLGVEVRQILLRFVAKESA